MNLIRTPVLVAIAALIAAAALTCGLSAIMAPGAEDWKGAFLNKVLSFSTGMLTLAVFRASSFSYALSVKKGLASNGKQ